MKKIILILIFSISLFSMAISAYSQMLPLVPYPKEVTQHEEHFALAPDTVIIVSEKTERIGKFLSDELKPATGWLLPVKKKSVNGSSENSIILHIEEENKNFGKEGYQLTISEKCVEITAAAPAGIFYACQTLKQLLPEAIESAEVITGVDWRIPCVFIEDQPRFAWRGLNLDVARHFFPKATIKRFIDVMASYKYNIFHWHLTDDQGWRIEIKEYPLLTEVGAWRGEGENRYGGFYTQEDIKEIIEYAEERFITIVPEIDMPGHALAILAAYPEFSCAEGPFEVATEWGIFKDVLCPCKEETFEFIEGVLSELMVLFPGPYVHIGGDESAIDQWEASALCHEKIKTLGLSAIHDLKGYFTQRVGSFVESKGKQFVGWDEIIEESDPSPSAIIMAWRKAHWGEVAAKQGNRAVMSPVSHCYFDLRQSNDPDEHGAPADWGIISLRKVYAFEPVSNELTPEQAALIIGAQGNIWTERIPSVRLLDYMTFPRMNAMAEVVWSPKEQRDWESFSQRMNAHYTRLDLLGIQYRKPDNENRSEKEDTEN